MPIETADFLIFLAAALALNLTPGNDMMYVIGQSMAGGARAGIAASLGIACGLLVHVGLAAAGLAVVLAQNPLVFEILRWAGAAYLVWIALRILMSPALARADAAPARSAFAAWRDGVLVNVLNPKIIIFVFAFLPPFVRPENGAPILQLLILGGVLNLGGTLVNTAVAIIIGKLRTLKLLKPPILRVLDYLSATVFLALAARLIWERR